MRASLGCFHKALKYEEKLAARAKSRAEAKSTAEARLRRQQALASPRAPVPRVNKEAGGKVLLEAKELKDAVSQRKLAMSEYTEVTDKLSELRQQKQKLSRTVRDKEEVIKLC